MSGPNSLIAKAVAQPYHIVLSEIVVPIKNPYGLARVIFQDVRGIYPGFSLEIGLPAPAPS